MVLQDHRAIERLLWPKGRSRDAWMLVDAARDRRIFGMLLDCFYSSHTCLFSGQLPPELEVASPYLVRLEYETPKTQRFLSHAAGNQWGVFLKCGMSQDDLLRHLRDLLVVQHPNGSDMLFRYYDPRVLRAFLPTCTREELRTVFGGIERFWIEDEEPGVMLNAGFDQQQLVLEKLPLQA